MKARILQPTAENLHLAAQALQQGEVVGIPTETVYGLAANAFSPSAVARIFEVKERPSFDPLIVHVSQKHENLKELAHSRLIDLDQISIDLQKKINHLIQTFWPGPLTLVLPKHPDVPDLVTSGLSTVAIRMPKHPIAQKLIQLADCPLAAPSANRFGRISPTSAQAVADELGSRIRWILDGRTEPGLADCEIGLESTVIGFDPSGKIQILRPGGVPAELIEEIEKSFLGDLPEKPSKHHLNQKIPMTDLKKIASPGQLEGHYAPRKPLLIFPNLVQDLTLPQMQEVLKMAIQVRGKILKSDEKIAFLFLSEPSEKQIAKINAAIQMPFSVFSLSKTGSTLEAAQNLFSTLRTIDQDAAIKIILAEPCYSLSGLGPAIQDRLSRASKGSQAK